MKKQEEYFVSWDIVDDFRMFLPKCKFDVVVGILNGGAVPALVASNVYKVPIVWCRCSSYKDRRKGEFVLTNIDVERKSIENKKVLIIDDIVDTGETVRNVYNFVKEYNPKKIKVVSIAIKNRAYQLCQKLGVEYILVVPDRYWVIFPWE